MCTCATLKFAYHVHVRTSARFCVVSCETSVEISPFDVVPSNLNPVDVQYVVE